MQGAPWQGGELACEPPRAVPEPARVILELSEHYRAKGRVQLWDNSYRVLCSLYCITPDM